MPKVTGQYKSDLREKIIQAAIESLPRVALTGPGWKTLPRGSA
jgi:hypothetical protein